LPGANNGAPKIKAISRIGKAAKKLAKQRNDFREARNITGQPYTGIERREWFEQNAALLSQMQ
jgi:hypothetical protein